MKSTIETLRDAYAFAVAHDACGIADEMLVAVDAEFNCVNNPKVWTDHNNQRTSFYLRICFWEAPFRSTVLALEWMKFHLPDSEGYPLFDSENMPNRSLIEAFLDVVDEWATENSVADSSEGEAEA